MPPSLSYPGVYIEEVSSGVRTISGVATSIAAFAGAAARGPVNQPVHLYSFADYERAFAEGRAGIEELGNDFPNEPICGQDGHRGVLILDDTGQHLVVAEIMQREGQLVDAARSASVQSSAAASTSGNWEGTAAGRRPGAQPAAVTSSMGASLGTSSSVHSRKWATKCCPEPSSSPKLPLLPGATSRVICKPAR